MSVTLSPRPPVEFHVARLRQSVAGAREDSKFSDDDLVAFLSEAYRSACERSTILRAKATISLVASQQEYDLPDDVNRLLEAYLCGRRLTPVPLRIASRDDAGGHFYEYDGVIGLSQTPSSGGNLLIYYVQNPAVLTLEAVPDTQFGPEWYYLLHHYAAHKCLLLVGGARYVKKAQWHRGQFEMGCRMLRRQAVVDSSFQPRMLTALEVIGGAG